MSDTRRVAVEFEGENGPTSISFSIKSINIPAFEKKLWELQEQLGPEEKA